MNAAQKACWEAARLIDAYGLNKHSDGDTTVGYCMLGAIRTATSSARTILEAYALVNMTLDYGNTPLWRWNDAEKRTAEDVIDVLVAASQAEFV